MVNPRIDLIKIEKERLHWSLDTFREATAISSLRKAESEIDEVEQDIKNNNPNPEEYADVLMCLFDSAGRQDICALRIRMQYPEEIRYYPFIRAEERRIKNNIHDPCKGDPINNLNKIRKQIIEIEKDIENNIKSPEKYAFAIMSLFDSAHCQKISPSDILSAYKKKVKVNKSRKWVKNPDNSYSHVKE